MKVIAGIIENRKFVQLYGPFENQEVAVCVLAHEFNNALKTKDLVQRGIIFARIDKSGKPIIYYDHQYAWESWKEYVEDHSIFGCTGGDSLTTWVHELDVWTQNNGGKFIVTKEFADAWCRLPWNG